MSTSSKKTDTAQQDASSVGGPVAGSNVIHVNFEGQPLNGLHFRGRACWIATSVGRALGYGANGGGLVDTMRREWPDEMIKGVDYDVLEGADLADFKALLPLTDVSSVSPKARSLVILYEPGLDMVCIKTEKPFGKKLRRLLVEKVFPMLRRRESPMPANDNAGLLGEVAALRAGLDEANKTTALLQAQMDELRQKVASGPRPFDGLVGKHDADIYILGPLKTLATELAAARRVSFQSVLTELDREVREAAEHPKSKKGYKWMRLPVESLGLARRAIFSLQDKHRAELDKHATQYAASKQTKFSFKPTG